MRYATRPRRQRSLFEYCVILCDVLDQQHGWWRDCFDGDDVAEWLAERWPLPEREVNDVQQVALSCLSDLEEQLFEALA